MKILSWNVAGIRAAKKKNNFDFARDGKYDIICFQETKCEKDQFPEDEFPIYEKYWHSTKLRKGLHGTSIWTKEIPLNCYYGFEKIGSDMDNEGRIITLEFDNFYLVTVYTPNSKSDLSRLSERTEIWDTAFRKYINELKAEKSTIVCGDLNCAYDDKDIYEPKGHDRCAGFTDNERKSFGKMMETFYDIHRFLYDDTKNEFTFWPYTIKTARPNNLGWRIDYFLIDKESIHMVKDSKILMDIHGSDHCPIELELH